MEDHEILLKFQDPASRNLAFNQLVRKYQRKVYWHVRKMVVGPRRRHRMCPYMLGNSRKYALLLKPAVCFLTFSDDYLNYFLNVLRGCSEIDHAGPQAVFAPYHGV